VKGKAETRPELGGAILRSVSRSFYLSIRLLPKPLREPVSLGYLLARATDTIADTATISASVRAQSLQQLAAMIEGATEAVHAQSLRDSFAPLQSDESERALIQALPEAIHWLEHSNDADRADIREVLRHITRGQALDIARFGDQEAICALNTADELDEYTYLVAGCVGEFWTRVGFRHVAPFARLSEAEMTNLGVRYGKGLQLINVLRDVGADLRAGRCYLPADELAECGVAPADLLARPAPIAPLLLKWQEIASAGIAAGLEYACAIQSRRVRFATVLPALIGARTLALLREAGPNAVTKRVKVPRTDVRRILIACTTSFASPVSVRDLFRRLSD
jgi:farnesyl-diphosphate farnesyltransferase